MTIEAILDEHLEQKTEHSKFIAGVVRENSSLQITIDPLLVFLHIVLERNTRCNTIWIYSLHLQWKF